MNYSKECDTVKTRKKNQITRYIICVSAIVNNALLITNDIRLKIKILGIE